MDRKVLINEALLNGIKENSDKLFVPFAMTHEEIKYLFEKIQEQTPEDDRTIGEVLEDMLKDKGLDD